MKTYKDLLLSWDSRISDILVNNSKKLFIGCEIEVIDGLEDNVENEKQLNHEAKNFIKYASNSDLLVKHDGTVDLECITPPLLYDDLLNKLNDTFTYLKTHTHFKSWDEGRCGLHLHFNKKGVKSPKKLFNFFLKNKDFFRFLSGRKNFSYCSFETYALEKNYYRKSGRYTALNFKNNYTIEFRLWRGSLNFDRVKMYVDVSNTMCKFSHFLNKIDLIDFVFLCNNDFLDSLLSKNPTFTYIMDEVKIIRKFFDFKGWKYNLKNLNRFKNFKEDIKTLDYFEAFKTSISTISIENENVENEDVENENVENEDVENENVENEGVENEGVENENIGFYNIPLPF